MKRIGSILTVVVACVFMAFAPAQAAPIIDFVDQPTAGGTIVFDGANYVGTDIGIGSMRVTYPPMVSYAVSGSVGGFGDLDFDTGLKTISITGGIAALGIADDTVLLNGKITSWSAVTNGGVLSLSLFGIDEKNPLLLEELNIAVPYAWSFSGFTIASATLRERVFTARSTDILNTPVPEPSTMLLLGAGLLGLGLIRRKKQVR